MITPDQSQMLAALGVPTGPGAQLPAGMQSIFVQPAASWVDPQWPLVSMGPQWMNSMAVMKALAPEAPLPPEPNFGVGG
jgi:hypothetical protein